MARPARPLDRSKSTKLLRVAGLPAVSALFATAPQRVERLFFDQRMRSQVGDFCAELARARKAYRMVSSERARARFRIGHAWRGGCVGAAKAGADARHRQDCRLGAWRRAAPSP